MPNDYFQFKQFRIEQFGASMKVTTEGCILGAWVDVTLSPDRVLDIGAGTGLLSLMLAQRFREAKIDAVEIDGSAYRQAKANFEDSTWTERLSVYKERIQDFDPGKKYDLIISNPPFFNRSLLSAKAGANLARHDTHLSQVDLIKAVKRLLSDNGVFYVLYPPDEAGLFCGLAGQHGLWVNKRLTIYNASNARVFRVVSQLAPTCSEVQEEEQLVIRNAQGTYTEDFTNLLCDYYLHLK